MKNPTRLLVLLAVSAFALSVLPFFAFADEKPTEPTKDAKAPALETKAEEGKAKADPTPVTPAVETPAPVTPTITPAPVTPPVTPPAPPAFTVQPAQQTGSSVLGSLDDAKLRVAFSSYGASIHEIHTADYRKTVAGTEPYTVLQGVWHPDDSPLTTGPAERPFAARAVIINGTHRVSLSTVAWEKIGDGKYSTTILDAAGKPALLISRSYAMGRDATAYEVTCKTSFKNLSDQPLSLVWEQNAQGDVEGEQSYQGDPRHIVLGYYNLDYDKDRNYAYTKNTNYGRIKALDAFQDEGKAIWPNEDVDTPNELLWIAMTNRYFTAVVHRPLPVKPVTADGQAMRVVGQNMGDIFEPAIGMQIIGDKINKVDRRALMLTLTTRPLPLKPGEEQGFDLALYAGPRLKTVLNQQPYSVMSMGAELVRYEMGCSVCLFQGLANFLLGFLRIIHAIVFDWGFAIIILVLVVRLLLHPITKKAQINMTKMSKQMAKLQPEMAKMKERFKNDPAKQQQEMMRLYREHNVSPMGFLGCLPMFLQMPIWVALYAMLYGAIELRHEPAFWGIFQVFGGWGFLQDLSAPDNFIKFGEGSFTLPLCGLQITNSLNILPILMAIVFYVQQKLTAPPPTNEQMAQQQKMMKWMTLIFPVFFYSAPSGLTLYIMSSSLAGIVDSYIVRRHIKREEEAGTLFQKKAPKPGGFFDRMQKMVEAKQKELEAKQAEMRGGKRPGDKKKK